MLPITDLAGRYHLEELIAIGGMGEVWRAMDQALARRVAVKLLRPEYLHDEVTLLRFRAEAQHAGLLNHPGIAQIYDYQDASQERPAYLVMELVNGPSLAAVLAAERLEPRRTADVLAQAATALHAAHTAGVLHRDIKPGNLLLAPGGQVKVTDFGIAQSSRTGHLTVTGALIGTTGYLAPERVSGRSATVASDLYALGIVGYECLTGQPPFQGEPLQIALAHREEDLPDLPPWCLAHPGGPELAGLIAALTAKDPAARPASAAVVAGRAARIRDGRAGQADDPGDSAHDRASSRDGGAGSRAGPAPPTAPGPVTRPSPDGPGLVPSGGPRHRRLGPAGLAAGVLIAGLLGWLLATVQADPGQAGPGQARSGPSGSMLSPSHRAATPARSGASAGTVADKPSPSPSPARAQPPPGPKPAAARNKVKAPHVAPGQAKHSHGPPPGHG